jgi:N-dimethylarginine dimethylaminohydrolase
MADYGTCDEYSRLRVVATCPPTYFQIRKPINVVQAKWHELGRGPDPDKATHQYEIFKNTLVREGVTVWEIPPSDQYTYQVFTRDISIITDNEAIIANLKFDPRKGEEKEAVKALKTRGIPVSHTVKAPAILEGGDFIFIDKENVLLGIGDRTNENALEKLSVLKPSIKFHK